MICQKTWFEPVADPSAASDEAVVSVQPARTEPNANTSPDFDHATVTPRSSGDGRPRLQLPTVTQDDIRENISSPPALDSEGDSLNFQSAVSEGGTSSMFDTTVSEGEPGDLFMPNMIDLEESGLRQSPRLASQERKNYSLGTCLARFCAFGVLVAFVDCFMDYHKFDRGMIH